jgi:hypothetical protein
MLFANDIFVLNGRRYRLLHSQPQFNRAWAINLDSKTLDVPAMVWSDIASLEPLKDAELRVHPKPTEAMLRARDRALRWLGELPTKQPTIFDPSERTRLLRERAAEAGCSLPALYKALRRYWAGGQTPAALLPRFEACGKGKSGETGGRGARPRGGRSTYQLGGTDLQKFDDILKNLYFKDARISLASAYQRLLETHYVGTDGNGSLCILPEGERPTCRQFGYYLRTRFGVEVRLRKRKGDKDFEREDRAILGTAQSDCKGIGHWYEADATIADVYLVSSDDVRQIIGKPTIYLIIDRRSRLIVGWYVGLENPSWICAMQAILSISQDKQKLCAHYGVPYNPADWPAHELFPEQFLADRGEMCNTKSVPLSAELGITVAFLPSRRADWKPVVECGFKQLRTRLEDGTPAFDPPENARKRQGKHYELDACLTLHQFTALVLNAIITHNRTPLRSSSTGIAQLGAGVDTSPIGIWNHELQVRAGVLRRYRETDVRMALLPRAEATVTGNGIVFANCIYSCAEAVAAGWFVNARRGRFKLTVSYDPRLVDTVYVHDPQRPGRTYEARLTTRAQYFSGKSFAEVKALEHFRRLLMPEIEQRRIDEQAQFHRRADTIIKEAKSRLKHAGPKLSRSARKADTRDARENELRQERQRLAAAAHEHTAPSKPAEVVQLRAQPDAAASHVPPASPTAEALRRVYERMQNG